MPCCRHALSGVALFVASVTALLLRQAGCLAPMRRHEACAGRLPAAVKALTDQQPGHCGCMVPVTGVGSAGLLCGGQRRWQGTVVNATGWERCLVNASGRALLCGQCHGVGTAVWSMPQRGHCCVVDATGRACLCAAAPVHAAACTHAAWRGAAPGTELLPTCPAWCLWAASGAAGVLLFFLPGPGRDLSHAMCCALTSTASSPQRSRARRGGCRPHAAGSSTCWSGTTWVVEATMASQCTIIVDYDMTCCCGGPRPRGGQGRKVGDTWSRGRKLGGKGGC